MDTLRAEIAQGGERLAEARAEDLRLRAELGRWQRGELRHAEVIDTETGEASSVAVAVKPSEHPPKRPCTQEREVSSSLSQIVELSQQAVTIKVEVAEARRGERDAQDKLDDLESCVVCMERPRAVVLRPCCHYVCCSECAREQSVCPATGCKTSIQSRMHGISMAPHIQETSM